MFTYLSQYASHGFGAVSLCKENVKKMDDASKLPSNGSLHKR